MEDGDNNANQLWVLITSVSTISYDYLTEAEPYKCKNIREIVVPSGKVLSVMVIHFYWKSLVLTCLYFVAILYRCQ